MQFLSCWNILENIYFVFRQPIVMCYCLPISNSFNLLVLLSKEVALAIYFCITNNPTTANTGYLGFCRWGIRQQLCWVVLGPHFSWHCSQGASLGRHHLKSCLELRTYFQPASCDSRKPQCITSCWEQTSVPCHTSLCMGQLTMCQLASFSISNPGKRERRGEKPVFFDLVS